MVVIRKPGRELRAYLQLNKTWHHVYILSGFDQQNLLGEPVKMIEYKLTKTSTKSALAEKSKFHKTKPATRSQKRSDGA